MIVDCPELTSVLISILGIADCINKAERHRMGLVADDEYVESLKETEQILVEARKLIEI